MLTFNSDGAASVGQLLSCGQAGNLVGMSASSIRLLCNDRKLSCYRTPAGHRRVSRREVLDYFKLADTTEESGRATGVSISGDIRAVGYARISSRGSSSKIMGASGQEEIGQLERQRQDLRQYALAEFGISDLTIYSEVASGVNLDREKFNKVIELIVNGRITHLLLSHHERLTRLGYQLIQNICRLKGVKIIEVNKEDSATAEENALDLTLIADLFYAFQSKTYSKRASARRKVKLAPETIQRIRDLEDSHSQEEIVRILESEGHKPIFPPNKTKVSYAVVRRIARQTYKIQHAKERLTGEGNHIDNFINTQLIKVEGGMGVDPQQLRTKSVDVFNAYVDYCKANDLQPATRNGFSKAMAGAGYQSVCFNSQGRIVRAWVGVKIKGKEELSVEIRKWNKKAG